MSPINSLARVMGNANRFTINCQGETGPGRGCCGGHSFEAGLRNL